MFSKLQEKVRDTNSGQLENLWIATNDQGQYVKDPSNTTILTQRKQIEESLFERNAEHFAQAKNTPFAGPVL